MRGLLKWWGWKARGNTRKSHAAAVSRPRSGPAGASMPRNTLSRLCGCEDSQKREGKFGLEVKQDSSGVRSI